MGAQSIINFLNVVPNCWDYSYFVMYTVHDTVV